MGLGIALDFIIINSVTKYLNYASLLASILFSISVYKPSKYALVICEQESEVEQATSNSF